MIVICTQKAVVCERGTLVAGRGLRLLILHLIWQIE